MYNLASILESVLDKLDVKKFNKLVALKAAASSMKSLKSSDVCKTGKSRTEEEDSPSSKGETEDSESESDDLGVFNSDNIRAALRQMNYQVAYVAYGVCAPSVA